MQTKKISDERLTRLLADAIDEGESGDLISALTELQSLRTTADTEQDGKGVKDALFTTIQDAYLHGLDWGRKYGSTEEEELAASHDYAVRATARLSEASTALASMKREVERLTDPAYLADKIERVGMVDVEWKVRAEAAEARIQVLEEALKPFADRAFQFDGMEESYFCSPSVTVGSMRAASQALGRK